MKRILCISLFLLLLLTACGAKQAEVARQTEAARKAGTAEKAGAVDVSAKDAAEAAAPDEAGEEVSAVSLPAALTQASTQPERTVASTQPTAQPKPPAETTVAEVTTTGYATIVTDTFIVKKVQGTLLTLYKYDATKGGELKSGAYTADYGGLTGSYAMHFSVGDIVTVRYDPEVAETYPMQLTVREIYPAEWNN